MARTSWQVWMKALAAGALLLAGVSAAGAQARYCTPHGDMVAQLGQKYQEKQFASGAVGQVAVMEVFVADSGTWTVVVTDVTGKSCIIAAGDAWEQTPLMLSGNDA
jgi:hypothetical protein